MPIAQTPTPPAANVAVPEAPATLYQALTNQQDVLRNQMADLVDQRADLVRQLGEASQNALGGPAKTGIEDRITAIDKRIAGTDQQLALVDAQIAKQAAVPGAVVPRQEIPRSGPPDEAFVLGGLFMIIVLLPLTIAYARRIWRRSAAVPAAAIPADLAARIQRIEHAVETSGLEIERIGEGQRFITKLFSEKLPVLPASREETRDARS